MLDRSVVFLDVETTGASPSFDRITEIGLVEVDRGEYVGEWSTLVNPGRGIPTNIQQLTGITDAMVENAPPFSELAVALHRRLEGKVLVAHNARFDHGFLSNEFRRIGMRYQPEILCTVKLSRKLFPQHPRHNLDSVIERHGLVCNHRHRALGDAQVLWHFAREIHIDPGPDAVREAVDNLLRKPVLPPGLASNALDDVPESPGAYIFYGKNNAPLFAGKSMNLSSRIHSHFSGESRSGRDRRIAAEVTRVEWHATAGELGALIKHAQLIRNLAPLQNRRARQVDDHCALQWDPIDGPDPPVLVDTGDAGFWNRRGLYGLFRSRRVALNALRELADAHGLCHIAAGLDRGKGPCLGRQLNRCKGLCVGEESGIAHAMRMMQALHPLRLQDWPFDGRIGIREHDSVTDRSEIHVFDRWHHLGSVDSPEQLGESLATRQEPAFDFDTYKLLRKFLRDLPREIEILRLP
ncbi:MAG TPA: exonuclease domain-containing protein [Burkholderiales bacterium]